MGAAIASVGASLPIKVVPNAEIAPRIGVSDEWIVRRTGIRSRRVAEPTERLSTHATNAAAAALRRAGVSPEQVDLVLVATTTPDEVMPNAAPLVAHELGAVRAGAFDIGAACTGFLSALAVGTGQIEAGRAQCVVVIGADFMSRILDPRGSRDRRRVRRRRRRGRAPGHRARRAASARSCSARTAPAPITSWSRARRA